MFQLYICTVLAGLFAANGVPHFVIGGLGQKHQTPFGKSSSAVVNVCWGWVNFVVAGILLHFAHIWAHEYRAVACFAVGLLVMTLLNGWQWSRAKKAKQA